MKIINFSFILIITVLLSDASYSYENSIIHKINNEIITKYDVKKEANYLRALNTNSSLRSSLWLRPWLAQVLIKKILSISFSAAVIILRPHFIQLTDNTN
jgi:hypothetical protein